MLRTASSQKTLMPQIIAIMNEKYALDASLFTRRDRRGNAQAGYWNGGPVPCGYRAYTASMEGRKARRKLEIFEEEAAIVRLIFNLALRGLDGQPMGTRSIAAFLNNSGYTLKGKPFRHSNVGWHPHPVSTTKASTMTGHLQGGRSSR